MDHTLETFVPMLRKAIKNSYQSVGDTMVAGGIKDMAQYKYLLGQAHAFQLIDQEIGNRLKKKKKKKKNDTERPENVVDFTKPKD